MWKGVSFGDASEYVEGETLPEKGENFCTR